MADENVHRSGAVNTVLGPVQPSELGIVAVHEALLSVLPGAQYAPDISMDRAEIFEVLEAKLNDFRAHGGQTIVDSTGMFHGRDLKLYEALSRSTGVHIVASTGLGPEELMGGYFLTPQTNPPTPWPAEKFAELFAKEILEGMVIPRVERRAAAGLITAVADRGGITPTEVSLFKGSARAARDTGVALTMRFGSNAPSELDEVLAEGLAADRVVISGVDRADAVTAGVAHELAKRGVFVAIDHVGQNNNSELVDDAARVELIRSLIDAGFANRIILSSNAVGVAKGIEPVEVPYGFVLTNFVPMLTSAGVDEAVAMSILVENPRDVLTVRATAGVQAS